MQNRCAPAASAARACSRIWSGSIIACIGVSASAKRDCAQKPQSSAQPPDLALTSEHMSVESAKRSTRAFRQIEDLIERAWKARVERFADSTDMCSLVNAKSGGCAEDCGFCAQSRFADAETPMHAMMEPEQILEHARAAEAAGAHRFCMVTQGQGLSKRDFQKYLQGVRLVSEKTNLKRCASVGHISAERARALREAGIQRVHHNVETAQSYYDEGTSTGRYEGRLRTIDAVREAGLETRVGGIPKLGETREHRAEEAFAIAAINPSTVPIHMVK